MAIGYRHGDIGTYSGANKNDAKIAWKALDFEFREQENDHIRTDIAGFLGMSQSSAWPAVLAEFKNRYGNVYGIWLSKSLKEAKADYGEYGNTQRVPYDPKNIVSEVGNDIYVILPGASLDDNLLNTGYYNDKREWVPYTTAEYKRHAAEYWGITAAPAPKKTKYTAVKKQRRVTKADLEIMQSDMYES